MIREPVGQSCRRPSCARKRQEITQYTNNNHNNSPYQTKYTEGGDKTSQYSYLVVILSNWVPDNWVYRLPIMDHFRPQNPQHGKASPTCEYFVKVVWNSIEALHVSTIPLKNVFLRAP